MSPAAATSRDSRRARGQPEPHQQPSSYSAKPEPLSDGTLLLLGISLIAGSLLLLVIGVYAVLLSSFMPDTGYPILDAVKYDEHYKYLVPCCIPAGLVFVIVNWGGLHYFRHA